jgi:hypothetical protein
MDHRPSYRHTQIGWAILAVTLILPAMLYFAFREGEMAVVLIVAAVVALLLALFATMTVDIDERRFRLRLGAGVIRRSIPLNTISAYAPVRNAWYYGWGIRLTPFGMLYNVSGRAAVELLLDDGRRVRVGTDEPDALLRALESATGLVPTTSIEEFPVDVRWRPRVRRLIAMTVGVVAAWMLGTLVLYRQPPSVELSDERFAVRVGLHSIQLPIDAIESVQLLPALPGIVRRTNGFAAGSLLRGSFLLDGWGRGRLFINRAAPPFLVARTRDTFVVVNFDDAERTEELYGELRLRVLVRPAPNGSRP